MALILCVSDSLEITGWYTWSQHMNKVATNLLAKLRRAQEIQQSRYAQIRVNLS